MEIDAHLGTGAASRQLGEASLVKGQTDFRGVDEVQRGGIASVEALAEDAPLPDFGRSEAEHAREASGQSGFRLVNTETQIRDPERHGPLPGERTLFLPSPQRGEGRRRE